MRYCKNCGEEIEEDAMFCPGCGTRIENESVAESRVGATDNRGNQDSQTIVNIPIAGYNPKWDYTPIGMWGYFFNNILFMIPLIGWIFLFVYAFGGTKNINLRNYARSFFCNVIILAVVGLIIALCLSGM